ncbi:MAG: restriction endonuclease subunit S [Actinobacteria bacterium]|nr:restriction endonuclease subunit S [Actinomycetota bacterium]
MKKPYPEYKDSGIDWIENIPEHWHNSKIKYTGKIICGGTPSTDNNDYWNGNIPWLQSGKVQYNTIHIDNVDKYITDDALKNSSTKMVKKDSVLIAITGATCSNIGHLTFNSTINQSIIGIENSKDYLSWFIFYYLTSQKYQILSNQSGGAQGGVTKQDIENIIIPKLPISEQEKIVSFLNNRTKLIDELIEKTKQKIELLKEKRTSLINHCVTKGLNPNVEMKDSGVEWIGKIPSHWSLIQLKYLISKVGSGVTPRGGSNVYCDEGIPFLRSQNIQFYGLELDDVVFISKEIHEQMSSSKVIPNDVLFNITGASIGRCFHITPNSAEYNVNQHVCIIRPNEMILTKFLYYCLRSDLGQIQIYLNNTGSGKEGLNFQNIKSFLLIKISKTEQRQIVDYLDSQIQKIDTLIEKENKRIELLKEYRQSLISEAVTGKIDVRDVAV